MRAATVALVLIVGAAIVLWYGNTLNSWVLGGLIGGLAALLLSIPISLMLFSHLSRRHDEQLQAEAQEEMSLSEFYDYPEASVDVYETDVPSSSEEQWAEQDNYAPRARNLPVPSPYPRLPVARQNQAPAYRLRATDYQLAPERQPRDVPGVRINATANSPRRPAPGLQPRYPGFPGYKGKSQRALQQTAALRAARQEAVQQQQQYSDTEFFPMATSKRLPAVRTSRSLPPQPQAPNQFRPRRTVEGFSVPPGVGRALPGAGETSANPTTEALHPRMREPQTDQLSERHPKTGSFRQQSQEHPRAPQTGTRNPHIDAQRRNPDVISGSLKNPLVRRAPYMYEDDPLRQELAQHIEAPSVRRSSRYAEYEDEEN